MNGVSDAGALHALVCLQLRSGVEPGGFEAHLRAEAAAAKRG